MALSARHLPLLLLAVAPGAVLASQPVAGAHLSVRRTSHGVVHITAGTYRGLGYGLGFSYASDNLCQLADQVVTARGLRSRFFGGDNAASDTFMRTELSDKRVTAMFAATSQPARDLIRGFVAGYNRYLATITPAKRDPACGAAAWLMPIRVTDVYRMIAAKAGSEARFAAAIADARPDGPTQISQNEESRTPQPAAEASNGWAFGKETTANGRGLLLANPHFPWAGENRFYQLHLTIPGKLDVMGATIAPIPVVAIGFNKDVAWTHTVSPAARFTLFRLDLDPTNPKRYFVDGHRMRISRQTVSFPVKGKDGRLHHERHVVYETIYGPIVTSAELGFKWGDGHAYALADVNRDNVGQIDTWLAYAQAKSVEDIKRVSASSVALPWLTTEAADRNGDVLFGDFSRSPNVDAAFLRDCQLTNAPAHLVILDGSRSRCNWTHQANALPYIAGSALPSVERADYVANSNGSYWLVNDAVRLSRAAPLFGGYATEQNFRTRMGLTEIRAQLDAGASRKVRPFNQDVVEHILFSDRNYAAVAFLDDVLALCRAPGSIGNAKLAQACAVLAAWDRRNTVASRGAVLFREFWENAAEIPNLFSVPFSAEDPVNTPRGLRVDDPAVAGKLRQALLHAVDKLQANSVPLDRPLGEVQGVVRNGERIPVPGGLSAEGVLNSMQTTPLGPTGYTPVHGTSYIQIVGFDDTGPVTRGLLAYGQSTDPRSPWFSDQTQMFAQGDLYHLPFTEAEIVADPGFQAVAVPDDPILHQR